MNRRPKVWISEDQILAAIDCAHRKAGSLVVEECNLRKESSELFGELEKVRFELMHSDLSKSKRKELETKERVTEIEASNKKSEAEAKAKAYARVIEKTLPRLGEILAAFRTETMIEVLGSYKGVTVK